MDNWGGYDPSESEGLTRPHNTKFETSLISFALASQSTTFASFLSLIFGFARGKLGKFIISSLNFS